MIVVDASALVAIADLEPERDALLAVLARADEAVISTVNAVETGLILFGRRRLRDVAELNRWLLDLGIKVEPHRPAYTGALNGYLSYGRNYHPARLNLADCFAYALAKELDAPLLYKGDDFRMTDVRPAL